MPGGPGEPGLEPPVLAPPLGGGKLSPPSGSTAPGLEPEAASISPGSGLLVEGRGLDYIWLQPRLHTVTASITYGYSLGLLEEGRGESSAARPRRAGAPEGAGAPEAGLR